MIDVGMYETALRCMSGAMADVEPQPFGQRLIAAEIAGLTWEGAVVNVLFADCPLLPRLLEACGCYPMAVHNCIVAPEADIVYFGTPTIVNGKQLFKDQGCSPFGNWWTMADEMRTARFITYQCERHGVKRIISGLGSGDISVEQRLETMNGGRVVADKHFGDFHDYVLVRDL